MFEIKKSFFLPSLSTSIVPNRALPRLKTYIHQLNIDASSMKSYVQTCRLPLIAPFVLVVVMPLLKHYLWSPVISQDTYTPSRTRLM